MPDEMNAVQTPETILIELSKQLDVPVKFEQNPETQKMDPVIDVQSILSKLVALMVYVGWGVPINIMPPYNRVNADLRYWEKQFEVKPQEAKPEEPKQEG